MDNIKYSCNILRGTNKVGKLTSETNGYFTMVLGALDFPNSVGDIYRVAPAVELLEESSSLQRRIASGQCRGEYGHPKRMPGMSQGEFLNRILIISEERISHHIRKLYIDKDSVKDQYGKRVIAFMGEVKPCGPYGEYLKTSLENPDENVAFSIRSLTQDQLIQGTRYKDLKTIITFDAVSEPGISVATKYHNPALENIPSIEQFKLQDFDEAEQLQTQHCVGFESQIPIKIVRSAIGWQKVEDITPPSSRW